MDPWSVPSIQQDDPTRKIKYLANFTTNVTLMLHEEKNDQRFTDLWFNGKTYASRTYCRRFCFRARNLFLALEPLRDGSKPVGDSVQT